MYIYTRFHCRKTPRSRAKEIGTQYAAVPVRSATPPLAPLPEVALHSDNEAINPCEICKQVNNSMEEFDNQRSQRRATENVTVDGSECEVCSALEQLDAAPN